MEKKLLSGLFIIAMVMFLAGCVTTNLPEYYTVKPKVLENHGGTVKVDVDATIPPKSFNKKDVVEFNPVLKYNGNEKPLKSLTLVGEKAKVEGVKINTIEGGKISYSESFAYEPEMWVSELTVKPVLKKKNKKIIELDEIKLADGIINTSQSVFHDEDIYHADRQTCEVLGMDCNEYYELETLITKMTTIYFKVNLHKLDLKLPLNKDPNVIQKLDDLKAFAAKGWKVRDIDIDAWASPEGEESFNEGLSGRRAETGYQYLIDMYKKLLKDKETKLTITDPAVDIKYNKRHHGEDWDGFMKKMEASNVPDKNVILNVVRSQPDVTKREQEIRNMTLIYKEIEEYILPPLRRVEMKINAFEYKRPAEEIARLAVTDPGQLTDKELLYAGTLTDDLDTKLKIYNAYVSLFPGDWKGYNNAAWVHLMNNNTDEATPLLEKANELSPNNPMVTMNMGAKASKIKEYKTAENYYNQAKNLGADVNYNVGICNIIYGSYDKALTLFGNKKCNYNVALAKILTGNMNGAESDLTCAPENPQTFYLMAILGARTDNTAMVMENLEKAIQAKDKCKMKAKDDREFLNYFDNPDFKRLVE